VQIVRKVRLVWQAVVEKCECGVMQCALRLWRAVVWHVSCANILSRFRPGPGYHADPPRFEHDAGALFFLLPLNYTRTASPVESFCHNGLVRRQLLEEFRVCLDGCQTFAASPVGLRRPVSQLLMVSRLVPSTFAISLCETFSCALMAFTSASS
jgi:hypothetical protein